MSRTSTNPRTFGVWSTICRNAEVHHSRVAFAEEASAVTHGYFRERCERLAISLAALGIKQGERIALLSENHISVFVLIGAAARLGLVVVPLNWRLTGDELTSILDDCRPVAIVADDATRSVAASLADAAGIRIRASVESSAPGWLLLEG